jgi:hypothetical protein
MYICSELAIQETKTGGPALNSEHPFASSASVPVFGINMKFEKLKDWPGYSVSREGHILGKQGTVLSTKCKDPYVLVNLCIKGKVFRKRVHRVVAEHFIPNPENLPQVDHIDGNKKNDCVDNLRWVTRMENAYNKNTSLAKEVELVNPDGSSIKFRSIADAGRELGISPQGIGKCANGKYKTAGGFRWRLVS